LASTRLYDCEIVQGNLFLPATRHIESDMSASKIMAAVRTESVYAPHLGLRMPHGKLRRGPVDDRSHLKSGIAGDGILGGLLFDYLDVG
jgi:hypothetical protein